MSVTAEKDISAAKDLFLKNLRGQTAYWHKRLEETDLSKFLLDENISISGYQQYLAKMYGFVKPFEDTVLPQLQYSLPDIHTRKKAGLLQHDLLTTGMSQEDVNGLPLFAFEENWQDPNVMGALYVMEGSTLGGAVIYKHVHKVLGITNEQGASYFYGYGQTTGSSWKTFIHPLTQYAVENNVGQQITDSAENTFKNIHSWFVGQ